jgi:hypothetical protein
LYDENKWEIDETEAGMVKYIYDLYLKEGLGTMRIPFRLNEEGHHTRRGHRWGFNVVYNILSSPAYKGDHPKGYKMPAIIDEETWEKAQKKRREARHVRKTVHDWLLQGRCICGECGHAMSCQQKDRNDRRHYGCLGRFKDTHLDGSPACKLPRMKADLLERAVWERLKAVLTDSETLREGMRNSLDELMGRRKQLYQSTGSVDEKLEAIVTKKEKLGLTFADGAISRETYQKKLQEAIKIEKDLLRSRDNLNPDDRSEIGDLDKAIASLEETINSSSVKILLTELGVQVLHIPEDWIVGHDSPVEAAGLENWNVIEGPGILRIPELGMTMNVVDGPEVNSNFEVTGETIWSNIRDIFNRLNIKVYVFKDKVEIRGNIPTEIIDIPEETTHSKGGPIICSGRGLGG